MLAASLIGTVPTWLAVVALVVIGYFVIRGSSGQALGILEQSNKVLSDKVQELERQRKSDLQQIAALESRTSLEPMVGAVVEQFAVHEQRASERHEALLKIANTLAERLERAEDGRPGGRRRHDPPRSR